MGGNKKKEEPKKEEPKNEQVEEVKFYSQSSSWYDVIEAFWICLGGYIKKNDIIYMESGFISAYQNNMRLYKSYGVIQYNLQSQKYLNVHMVSPRQLKRKITKKKLPNASKLQMKTHLLEHLVNRGYKNCHDSISRFKQRNWSDVVDATCLALFGYKGFELQNTPKLIKLSDKVSKKVYVQRVDKTQEKVKFELVDWSNNRDSCSYLDYVIQYQKEEKGPEKPLEPLKPLRPVVKKALSTIRKYIPFPEDNTFGREEWKVGEQKDSVSSLYILRRIIKGKWKKNMLITDIMTKQSTRKSKRQPKPTKKIQDSGISTSGTLEGGHINRLSAKHKILFYENRVYPLEQKYNIKIANLTIT